MIEILSLIDKKDIIEISSSNPSEVRSLLFNHCLRNEKQAYCIIASKKNKEILLSPEIALLHIRHDEVNSIKMAVGLFREKAYRVNGSEVKSLICIIIPSKKSQSYLSLMAHLSRLFHEENAREVFAKGSADDIMNLIKQFEGQ